MATEGYLLGYVTLDPKLEKGAVIRARDRLEAAVRRQPFAGNLLFRTDLDNKRIEVRLTTGVVSVEQALKSVDRNFKPAFQYLRDQTADQAKVASSEKQTNLSRAVNEKQTLEVMYAGEKKERERVEKELLRTKQARDDLELKIREFTGQDGALNAFEVAYGLELGGLAKAVVALSVPLDKNPTYVQLKPQYKEIQKLRQKDAHGLFTLSERARAIVTEFEDLVTTYRVARSLLDTFYHDSVLEETTKTSRAGPEVRGLRTGSLPYRIYEIAEGRNSLQISELVIPNYAALSDENKRKKRQQVNTALFHLKKNGYIKPKHPKQKGSPFHVVKK